MSTMLTNNNIEQFARMILHVLRGRMFTLESYKKWPGLHEREEETSQDGCKLSADIRRPPVGWTPFEATDEPRWLRISLTGGRSLMVPATVTITRDGLAHPTLVIRLQDRLIVSYYGLSGRFFKYTFLLDQPEPPRLLGAEELPTMELPAHLAALSRR